MDAKLRDRLAALALVLIAEWWDLGEPGDIDGGWIQDQLAEAGLFVAVPPGTHDACDTCEDGLYECSVLAPDLVAAMKERGRGKP